MDSSTIQIISACVLAPIVVLTNYLTIKAQTKLSSGLERRIIRLEDEVFRMEKRLESLGDWRNIYKQDIRDLQIKEKRLSSIVDMLTDKMQMNQPVEGHEYVTIGVRMVNDRPHGYIFTYNSAPDVYSQIGFGYYVEDDFYYIDESRFKKKFIFESVEDALEVLNKIYWPGNK